MKVSLSTVRFNPYTAPDNRQKKNSLSGANSVAFRSSYPVIKPQYREYIHSLVQKNQAEFLGKGTFGIVYKITLPVIGPVAVKVLNNEDNSAYGGGNLLQEAEILRKMPKECARTQNLVDFFTVEDKDYLVTSFIKGSHLSGQDSVSSALINNIVDELSKYDEYGLMFYDLNPNNINVHNNNPGFFDFEFMERQPIENLAALNDLHHLDRNIFTPRKSNLNSFENRTLGTMIDKVSIKDYLQALSKYYSKREHPYDKILADIYKEPDEAIVSIEKDLITLRSFTLNYYLYLHRLKNNALLNGDIENYGNFDKYIDTITEKALKIKSSLETLSGYDEYRKVNLLITDNLLKMNCSKPSYEAKSNPQLMELKNLKDKAISSKGSEGLDEFEALYQRIRNLSPFCDDLRSVLYNTLNFLSSGQ